MGSAAVGCKRALYTGPSRRLSTARHDERYIVCGQCSLCKRPQFGVYCSNKGRRSVVLFVLHDMDDALFPEFLIRA